MGGYKIHIIGAIYKPPCGNLTSAIETVKAFLKKYLIVVGCGTTLIKDLNINYGNEECNYFKSIKDLQHSNFYVENNKYHYKTS